MDRYEFSPSTTINNVARDETKGLDGTAGFSVDSRHVESKDNVGRFFFFAIQKGITLPCKEYAEEGPVVDGLFCKEIAQRLVKRIQRVTREIPQSRGFTILLHDNYARVRSAKKYSDHLLSAVFTDGHGSPPDYFSFGLNRKARDNDFTRSPIFKTI